MYNCALICFLFISTAEFPDDGDFSNNGPVSPPHKGHSPSENKSSNGSANVQSSNGQKGKGKQKLGNLYKTDI